MPAPSRLSGEDIRVGEIERVLAEQADYYRARAGEYDDWWLRRGRYDHGPEANARWFTETAALGAALDRFAPAGSVLELACGTGLWTERLAPRAASLTAIDASSEMLAICRARVGDANVVYGQADIFAWEPQGSWDVCFFSFWLSHVPYERFAAFWEKVERSLAPGGRVFFIDSASADLASARDHPPPRPGEQTALRRLADGSEYTIVKHWFEPEQVRARLLELGWEVEIGCTPTFFLYGEATPAR